MRRYGNYQHICDICKENFLSTKPTSTTCTVCQTESKYRKYYQQKKQEAKFKKQKREHNKPTGILND